ncbi:Pol polyprotein [Plakobranchus ocellatus]|uniref:Pol polyprotein n=1 Tax=Plakobranchus ocellatus TaxID=259542 RepID=A0AAV3ZBG4_9GAST|nr:Pol polyprotein [Plakobranchus ocellatus]
MPRHLRSAKSEDSSTPPDASLSSHTSFYGLIWNEQGVHPNGNKCDNIRDKPAPTGVKELQQFMGIIQHMSTFILKLSSHTDPLRKILHKETEWQSTESHEKAFQNIKNLTPKEMTLSYYHQSKATIIEVDSSCRTVKTQNRQNLQKTYFDKHARDLPPLIDHQQLSVQDTGTSLWSLASYINAVSQEATLSKLLMGQHFDETADT